MDHDATLRLNMESGVYFSLCGYGFQNNYKPVLILNRFSRPPLSYYGYINIDVCKFGLRVMK